jgi:hypothetical protein
MAKHTLPQREFIVRRLAAFEPPRAIVASFRALFPDTACDENDVLSVNPEAGALMVPDLFALFRAERERVLLDPASAPYANKQARLIALSNHAKFYAGNNQFPEMRTVLRHIAEETGDIVPAGRAVKPEAEKPRQITEIIETIVDPVAPAPVTT